jgi:hypothetical protein
VVAWGNNASKILNDWSNWAANSTNSSACQTDATKCLIQNSNAVVQAGWTGGLIARAAEILRYGGGTGSAPTSPAFNPTQVETELRNQFLPLIQNGAPGKNGNWETSCANSMIQIGAYLSDSTVLGNGIAMWNGRATNYIYMTSDGAHPNMPSSGYSGSGSGYCGTAKTPTSESPPNGCDPYGYWGQAGGTLVNGVSQETCRDFEHVQMGEDALFQGAETALIQGTDLFTPNAARFTAALEFNSKYLLQAGAQTTATTYHTSDSWLCDSGTFALTTSTSVTNPLPAYEIAYNEYANREGLSLPNTLQLITLNRSGAGWTYDNTRSVAWETLTHAGVGDVRNACVPYPNSAADCTAKFGTGPCGTVPNGCGGTYNCGSCTSPKTCGGGGVANVCGSAGCVPKTSCVNSSDCGVETDGCGGQIKCTGVCSGTTPDCGGDGLNPNKCSADSIKPTAPTAILSDNVTSTTVTFTWSGATDDMGVTGYKVQRGSTVLNSNYASTTYTDTGLTASTAYTYSVYSLDAAGNVSATASPTLSVTTAAACTPVTCGTTYCGLTADGCGGSIQCSTTCGTGVCGGGVTIAPPKTCADRFDTTTDPSCTNLNTCAADVTPPTLPTALTTTAVTTSSVSLGWTASADNIGVAGYNVYRDGTTPALNGSLLTSTSYTDSTVTSGTHTYQVEALDAAGNSSGLAPTPALSVCIAATCASNSCGTMSDGCGGTTNCGSCTTTGQFCASGGNGTPNVCGADTTPPTVPTGLTANTSLSTNSSLSFSWTASSDTINGDTGSGVNGYDVYRSTSSSGPFNPIATVGAAAIFKDTALAASTTYYYTVAAFDVAGNTSAQSSYLSMTTLSNALANLPRNGWVAISETYSQHPMAAIGVTTPGNSKFSMGKSQANGQYWQVDMGSPQTFRQINFYTPSSFTGDFPTSYNVDVSDDGKTWTNVVTNKLGLCTDSTQCTSSGTGAKKLYPTTTPNSVSVSSMTHRYIKITLSCGASGAPSCTGSPHGGYWAMGDGGAGTAGNGFEVQN